MGKKGMRHAVSHHAGVKRDAIWKAMRLKVIFTAPEIEALTDATRDNVRSYIGPLAQAGYLQCERPARCVPGDSYPKTWRLVKNTGPVAPRLTLDGLVDTNLQPVTARSMGTRLARHAPDLIQHLRVLLEALEPELSRLPQGAQKRALDAALALHRFDEAIA